MKTLRNFGYFNLLAGLPISYFMFTSFFAWMVPAGLLMVGLAWFYRTRPFLGPSGQAGLGLFPVLSTLVVYVGLVAWSNRPFRQTVLVPAGYRGLVVVGYGVAGGQPLAWDEDGRLIRLSPQGTAAVQFVYGEDIRGAEYDKFYEVAANGERSSLPDLRAQFPRTTPKTVGVVHTYVGGGPEMLVCVVARADSLGYYLEPESNTLQPAYAQRVKTIAATLGVPNQLPDAGLSAMHP